jgi:hypothetical protein
MSRATTITLANTLANSEADTTKLGDYYDEAVRELGLGVLVPGAVSLTGAEYAAGVEGQAEYDFPATALKLLYVLYDRSQLAFAQTDEANLYDEEWRNMRGVPVSFLTADQDQRTIAVIPTPDVDGQSVGLNTPFTTTFPGENLTFIYTEERDDVHSDEELPLALTILSRELSRDSNHADGNAAQLAAAIAAMLWKMCHS